MHVCMYVSALTDVNVHDLFLLGPGFCGPFRGQVDLLDVVISTNQRGDVLGPEITDLIIACHDRTDNGGQQIRHGCVEKNRKCRK